MNEWASPSKRNVADLFSQSCDVVQVKRGNVSRYLDTLNEYLIEWSHRVA